MSDFIFNQILMFERLTYWVNGYKTRSIETPILSHNTSKLHDKIVDQVERRIKRRKYRNIEKKFYCDGRIFVTNIYYK